MLLWVIGRLQTGFTVQVKTNPYLVLRNSFKKGTQDH